MELIDKAAVVAEIERRKKELVELSNDFANQWVCGSLDNILSFLDTLEAINPHKQRVQYASIKDGLKAHAVVYSFNIQSELFNQLTKEQQQLWRKEIEQACISGGEAGVELARDIRYITVEENKWNVFRRESAMRVMCAILSNYHYPNMCINDAVLSGVQYTDALIEELKKGETK